MQPLSSGIRWWFERLDAARRRRGMAMDRMGYGPQESPCEIVLEAPGMRLRRYGGGSQGAARTILIVPAPIKRHYIWDLAPGCSVVQRALQAGMATYLIEWTDPAAPDGSPRPGLEDYADRWIEQCVRAIHIAHPSGKLFLLGHSLGGVFGAIYAALRPRQLQGLVLIETPLHFGDASGAFGPLVAFGPPAAEMARLFDRVPGSVLSMSSVLASPATFSFERYADFFASLASPDKLRCHLAVERWTLDEAPMSGRLFEQVVRDLYKDDMFMRGALRVGEQELGPARVTAPLLVVYAPRSLVVPPASVIAFHDAAASSAKRLLAYHGDTGIALAHVGALVGKNAHRKLWPEIFSWIEETAATRH
jgi:polyhydroxyalkanoate synthase subunit PhaC